MKCVMTLNFSRNSLDGNQVQALCAPFGIMLLDIPISEPDVKVLADGALRGSGHISFLTLVSRALKIAYNCNVCCCHKNKYNGHLVR
jgi:hypothetical protein